MRMVQFVALALTLTAALAGCASTDTYPSASPPVLVSPEPRAPSVNNSDAAGAGSVPGYHSVPNVIVVPEPVR
jgi:hypothetical protein